MDYRFKKIEPKEEDWLQIEGAYDSTCYQTEKWYVYLKRIGAKPFIAAVYSGEEHIGYFLGEKKWLGIPMVTAPIEGYGTYTQGLNMLCETSEAERVEIYIALAKWVFDNHIALTFQVDDWQLRRDMTEWIPNVEFRHEVIERYGLSYSVRPTLHVPLNRPEEDLWAGLSYKSCKYCINKAKKEGLEVREVTRFEDIPAFCKEHHNQLRDVCRRKGMRPRPTQAEKRMRAVCESMWPDRVLMLEVVGKDENGEEQHMSSGIWCLDKGECIYWTGASYHRYMKYCPNEIMVWEAMKRLSERGGGDLNFGGMASYKLKFGTIYAYVPRLIFAKYDILINWSQWLKGLYHKYGRKLMERLKL